MGPLELLIIGTIAVLIFGKRLPEVGRSLGRGIVEFKKGIAGIDDDIQDQSRARLESPRPDRTTTADDAAVPKFEPPRRAPAQGPQIIDARGQEPV